MAKKTKSELNNRQQTFVLEYVVDFNATRAAKAAGYSEKTATPQAARLLTNVKVQAAIQKAMKKKAERVELSADWVLKMLIDNAERAMQATQVYDREGEPTGEYTYQGAVANKALELLGKHVGLFRDDEFDRMTPEEISSRLEKLGYVQLPSDPALRAALLAEQEKAKEREGAN